MDIAFAGSGVKKHQILFEGSGLSADFAVGGEGGARTIEDEGIVAADLVDVDDGALVMKSGGT